MSVYKQHPHLQNFSYRFQIKGRKYSGVCYGARTRTEAEAFETRIKAGVMRLAEQATLGELFENCRDMIIEKNPIYLDEAFAKAMAKPRRRTPCKQRERFKKNYWDDFVFFMRRTNPEITALQKVTPSHAEAYISLIRKHGNFRDYFKKRVDNRYSNYTANAIHSTVEQVFELLKSDSGMTENPFSHIEKLGMDSDSHEPYTVEELQRIFQHSSEFLYPFFMIGLFSGLRLGDICKLRKDEILFDRHFIILNQSKTGAQASIPMHEVLENYLRELFAKYPDSEYVLPEQAEQYQINPSTICNRVRRFLEGDLKIKSLKQVPGRQKAVNVKGIHSLRHTFCTIAGVVGIPEAVVRSIVGHMTPRMTYLYTRHIEEGDKLQFINLFGERLQSIPELPRSPLPPLPEDSYEAKLEAVIDAGNERTRLINLAQSLPLTEVRKILIELNERYPLNMTTVDTWQV